MSDPHGRCAALSVGCNEGGELGVGCRVEACEIGVVRGRSNGGGDERGVIVNERVIERTDGEEARQWRNDVESVRCTERWGGEAVPLCYGVRLQSLKKWTVIDLQTDMMF